MVSTPAQTVAFSLSIGSRTIGSEHLPALLERYQLMPQLVRELVIDDAISSVTLEPGAIDDGVAQLRMRNQIQSEEQFDAWLAHNGLTSEVLRGRLERTLKIEQYKQDRWESQLDGYFLDNKTQYDKAIYSLIRTDDAYAAQELYFRLQEDDKVFGDIASQYSQGPEAKTGGMVGPVPLGNIHPSLIQILSSSQPGQLHPPVRLDKWNVIVRLEQMLPAKLDDAMRQTLLTQLYDEWLGEQVGEVLARHNKPAEPDAAPQ
ncbi:MAG: peptidylprolyl isomerase [Cyanobacteria bacterium P01_A01_bin.3]